MQTGEYLDAMVQTHQKMDDYYAQFDKYLINLRKELGMTQVELAEHIGFANTYIAMIESKKYGRRPSKTFVVRLHQIYQKLKAQASS